MRNTRPADMKKMIQGLIILTLLCWATQTLVAQWGLGQEISGEKFVAPSRMGIFIELKREVTVGGGEIRLSDVARWVGNDVLEQTGDLVVGRFASGKTSLGIDQDEVKAVLEGAGINLASIDFSGALRCVVMRTEATPVEAPIVDS